jgi:putative membrane protein
MKTSSSFLLRSTSVLACLAISAIAHSYADDAAVNSSDKSFMKNAAEAGMAEVKAGEMAKAKSANPDVKAFGEQMVTDHTKAGDELKALASTKKVEMPKSPSLMQQGKAKLLDAKTGADFDKAFAETMVSDHKTVVDAFKKASTEATDSDVKAFAAKTLPTLEMHLKMAEDLQNKVGK